MRGRLPTLALALCAISAFSGAALLFVVQPLLAKWLLPWFGGSPGTWAACMVFFQGMLLAGYAYAHGLVRLGSLRAQRAVHALVVLGAAVLAAQASELKAPAGGAEPPLQIARLLFAQVGASYFVLATTAPLAQHWAAALGREPYALYALSNAGSLLGLIAYPFAIEPRADLPAQLAAWTYAFLGYAALSLVLLALARPRPDAARSIPRSIPLSSRAPVEPEPSARTHLRWLGLSLAPSALLLAVTTHITVDVAAVPLLWVAPLALYLITFIVAFSRLGPRARGPMLVLYGLAVIGLGFGSFAQGSAPLWQQLGAPCLALFAAGLLCHGELARTRPAPEHLTRYYVVIALGGALGALAVSWLAPALLDDDYELEAIALLVFALLALEARAARAEHAPRAPAAHAILAWSAWSAGQRRALYLGLGLGAPLLLAGLTLRAGSDTAQGQVIERRRSFLGALRVIDTREGRWLAHGRIRHGMQLRGRPEPGAPLVATPTLYFAPGTALERVFTLHATDRPRALGVVGLGVGTIASYARAGDRIRFYELDPHVVDLAQRRFTFLRDSPARVELALGDGRLTLAREPAQRFDILVLDAFASDAVPVHLLTREAFALYARHLAPGGVLIANASNRHLAIDRAVCGAAAANGLTARVVETAADAASHRERVRWVVMMRDPDQLAALLEGLPHTAPGTPAIFTDQKASLLSLLTR